MATDTIRLSAVITAEPERVYRAWLDSAEHSAFTGGNATIEPWVGGRYNASGGYIEGTTLELESPRRIVQTWRSAEFPEGSADSRLEVLLEPIGEGTRITLIHSEIPEGQGEKYRQGWEEYYLAPLVHYFGREAGMVGEEEPVPRPMTPRAAAPARKAAKQPAKRAKKAAKPAKRAKKVAKKPVRKTAKRKAARPARKAAKRKAAGRRKAAGKRAAPRRKAVKRKAARPARKAARRRATGGAKRKGARKATRRSGARAQAKKRR